jgi:Aspartyl protease/PDZ domain
MMTLKFLFSPKTKYCLALIFIWANSIFGQQPVSVTTFSTYYNLIFFKVKVNNSKVLNFLFDTGASGCVISEKTSNDLHLNVDTGSNVSTGGGDVEATYAKNVTAIILPNARLDSLTLAVIDLSGLESSTGEHIDGIIGYEAFEKWIVKIDYHVKKISFIYKKGFKYKGSGEIINLKIEDNLPYTYALLKCKNDKLINAKLLVDNGGASNDLRLNTYFTEANNLLSLNKPTLPLTYGAINVGKATGEVGRMKELIIGKIIYKNPLVNFSTTKQGEEMDTSYAGILNAPFLNNFTYIFDYANNKLILEKYKNTIGKQEFDMSGISLIASGKQLNVYTVRQVLNNSPASNAGILKGDTIFKINNRNATTYRLSEIRKLFSSKPTSMIVVSIKRADQIITKRFALKIQI